MSRPTLSYANVMSTIAVFLALGGGAWAVTGQPAATKPPVTVTACVKKAGKAKGRLRVIAAKAKCRKRERKLAWTSAPASTVPTTGAGGTVGAAGATGPAGPAGPAGPRGDTGAQGPAGAAGSAAAKGDTGATGPAGRIGPQGPAGSPDTPGQILAKLSTVDGSGSGSTPTSLTGSTQAASPA